MTCVLPQLLLPEAEMSTALLAGEKPTAHQHSLAFAHMRAIGTIRLIEMHCHCVLVALT
jgi:hypothetical protein